MAWQTEATSNEELCESLRKLGVITDDNILDAFKNVDRGLFAFGEDEEIDRSEAYADRPFREGSIHISAPHMYNTIIEALTIHREGLSFLNIGSGSGYLTCLVAHLAGERGVCHGIDINPATVEHSRKVTAVWLREQEKKEAVLAEQQSGKNSSSVHSSPISVASPIPPPPIASYTAHVIPEAPKKRAPASRACCKNIEYVAGNCFNLHPYVSAETDTPPGASNYRAAAPADGSSPVVPINGMRYDRIYVGAGCPQSRWATLRQFLRPDGIMVLPIDESNELVRVQMNSDMKFTTSTISSVRFHGLVGVTDNFYFPLPVGHHDDDDDDIDEIDEDDEEESEFGEGEGEGEDEEEMEDEEDAWPEPVAGVDWAHLASQHNNGDSEEDSEEEAQELEEGDTSDQGAEEAEVPSGHLSIEPELITVGHAVEILPSPVQSDASLPAVSTTTSTVLTAGGTVVTSFPQPTPLPVLMREYPLVRLPRCQPWTPATHYTFPTQFHNAMKAVLMGRHYDTVKLPLDVWKYMFSFCSRDWFVPAVKCETILRRELQEERKARVAAEESYRNTLKMLQRVERDRDSHRLALMELQAAASAVIRTEQQMPGGTAGSGLTYGTAAAARRVRGGCGTGSSWTTISNRLAAANANGTNPGEGIGSSASASASASAASSAGSTLFSMPMAERVQQNRWHNNLLSVLVRQRYGTFSSSLGMGRFTAGFASELNDEEDEDEEEENSSSEEEEDEEEAEDMFSGYDSAVAAAYRAAEDAEEKEADDDYAGAEVEAEEEEENKEENEEAEENDDVGEEAEEEEDDEAADSHSMALAAALASVASGIALDSPTPSTTSAASGGSNEIMGRRLARARELAVHAFRNRNASMGDASTTNSAEDPGASAGSAAGFSHGSAGTFGNYQHAGSFILHSPTHVTPAAIAAAISPTPSTAVSEQRDAHVQRRRRLTYGEENFFGADSDDDDDEDDDDNEESDNTSGGSSSESQNTGSVWATISSPIRQRAGV